MYYSLAVVVVYVHFCMVCHAHSVLYVVYDVTVFWEHFVGYCALLLRGRTLETIPLSIVTAAVDLDKVLRGSAAEEGSWGLVELGVEALEVIWGYFIK
jgi:hypothetical protein